MEIHTPLRKLSKREKKFRLKPWISRGLKTSIEIKNRMYEKICKYNQIQLKPRYNRYKKKIEKLIWVAQRKFYADNIERAKNDAKSFWKMLNEILSRNKKKSAMRFRI